MATKVRNLYNNDRLMWLGAFAPGLRKAAVPFQAPEQLAKPTQYPPKQGPLDVTMRIAGGSLMDDPKTKIFVNGVRVLETPPASWTDLPIVEENDLVTIWVYAPSDELPVPAKAFFTFAPQLTSTTPGSAFPANISGTMYGYVNGLEITSNTPVGNPVADGAPVLTYLVALEMATVKSLSLGENEIAQMVFTASPASGRDTEFGCRLQVVMCEKLERFQAVQHNGIAGGPFIADRYVAETIYGPTITSAFARFNGDSPYLYYLQDAGGALIPAEASYSTTAGGKTQAEAMTFVGAIPSMGTATYNGRSAYIDSLNLALGPVRAAFTVATGLYTNPSASPPGTVGNVPTYAITVNTDSPVEFDLQFKYSIIQILPNPTTDPEAVYAEVVISSKQNTMHHTVVIDDSATYSWPPQYIKFPNAFPPSVGGTSAITNPFIPSAKKGFVAPIVYAPSYVLSQYVDADTPEGNPVPGRAVYIQLTTTVELSDAQYAAMREAGVQSLSDFEQFVADNPDVGQIATETNFELDLNTPQMQDVLGTNQLDEDKAQALFDLLSNGMTGSEDFLAAQGNSIETKISPPSPSNMDKLKMAGKVLSGVNSLLTLGKIAANIGVLSTPLGLLMAINTGINIYNATQAAQGLANNQNPQYIPTINESIFNSLFRDPNPVRSNLPRVVPPFPKKIP